MVRVAVSAALAGLCFAGAADAQTKDISVAATGAVDADRLASAKVLIGLMNLDGTLDRMYVQLAPVFAKSIVGALSGDTTTQPVLAAIRAKPDGETKLESILAQEFMASMHAQYPAMKDAVAEEYAAAFTKGELDAIVAFYRSGPGAKALRLMPELQVKMALRGQALGRNAGEQAGRRAMERAASEILALNTHPKA